MTGFWFIAAALLALVLTALLRPLLRNSADGFNDDSAASNLRILRAQLAELDGELQAGRIDAEQHAVARSELERRVLEEAGQAKTQRAAIKGRKAQSPTAQRSRGSAFALALALPVSALALYSYLGSPEALDPTLQAAARAGSPAAEHAGAGDIEAAAQRLAARLQAEPANADGWALLGRTYARLERFEQARDAYAKALEHGRTPDATLLADYADVLAMTQGRRITPEAEALIMKALTLDPQHVKSLALAGNAAMARGDHALAVQYWTRARDQAPPDSELARGISSGIDEARAAAGLSMDARTQAAAPVGPRAKPQTAPSPPPAGDQGLRISVQLAPELSAKVPAGATLFVFARAAEGPRMPLAITRLPAAQRWPVQVQLDDAIAMSPQMRLSNFANVVVVARISAAGGATPQPGDLEGESSPGPNTGQVKLSINRVRS